MEFSPIKHHGIAEHHLQPDLTAGRKRRGDATPGTILEITTTIENYTLMCLLGEPLTAGCAIYKDTDGKWYKADNQSSPVKPAMAIACAAGVTDETVEGTAIKQVEVDGASFNIGDVIWLSSGSPNITTSIESLGMGDLIQRLGKALTTTAYLPGIQEAEFII